MSVASGLTLELEGLPDRGEQLALLGDRRPVRVPADRWRLWLSDPVIVARFDSKRYRRSSEACWPFFGAISSTGHGSFRAASVGQERRGTVPAHLFAFQLEHGVIPRLGWAATDDVTVCHQCDYAACTNPGHMRLGTNATNRVEYVRRRRNLNSPLADVRGAAGRSHAIAEAVRAGLRAGDNAAAIDARIRAAEDAGRPLSLW
ncbi:hypothetical protein O4328_39285 [Rhodococcus opacus]|uniref:HNH nuclease domain-containing protein n=1 Tax=Rhodococcus opacus TaxID=37919 RepID=A0AAX3YS77_RHOOP|nr:hypothetical protein [Rhodococcus opacus]MCZ4589615.1 hypothetical protein [Rhodococcus opacus]WLF51226.1 hypothetical protein Q5707_38335 [Rhodococcus opacus]